MYCSGWPWTHCCLLSAVITGMSQLTWLQQTIRTGGKTKEFMFYQWRHIGAAWVQKYWILLRINLTIIKNTNLTLAGKQHKQPVVGTGTSIQVKVTEEKAARGLRWWEPLQRTREDQSLHPRIHVSQSSTALGDPSPRWHMLTHVHTSTQIQTHKFSD